MNLYFDIETVPTSDGERIAEISSNITPPANYKSADAIAKWEREKKQPAFDKAVHGMGLCGTVGEIVCICWAIDNGGICSVDNSEGEEVMLRAFMLSVLGASTTPRQRGITWIGHYITGFDLRYLWQRCIINNVDSPVKIPYSAKPWDTNIFDTKIEWDGVKSSGFGALDSVSKAMGYQGKQGMTGADVWDYYKAGKLSEIVEYCKNDVDLTRKIHLRMKST